MITISRCHRELGFHIICIFCQCKFGNVYAISHKADLALSLDCSESRRAEATSSPCQIQQIKQGRYFNLGLNNYSYIFIFTSLDSSKLLTNRYADMIMLSFWLLDSNIYIPSQLQWSHFYLSPKMLKIKSTSLFLFCFLR